MKQTNLLKTFLLLCALVVGSTCAWADELYYTLAPIAGTNNAYANNCDIEIDGITWNVTGNSTFIPWRLGGKNLSKVDRAVYSKTAMDAAITEVKLEVGKASNITVNSLKLIVSTDEDGAGTIIDEVSATFAANSTISFKPTSPATEWAKDAYYKFVFNVSVSGSSNKFLEFTNAKFYSSAVEKTDPTITFNDGSVRVGKTLDVSTLFTSNSAGTVTYSITAGDSYASIDGNILTGVAEGSVTVQASQAETVTYNSKAVTATISVVDPALSSIAITTAPTKTTYDEGDFFDATGMVVTATLADASTEDVTASCTWTPNGALTTSDTEVTISYTYKGVTKTVTQDITVNAYVQQTQFDIALNNTLFGTSYGGSASGITDDAPVSGKSNKVNVVYAGGGNHYINNSQIRIYPNNKLTFEAPAGYVITKIVFTEDGQWSATISSDKGTYTSDTKTWTGEASSVLFTGSGSGHCRISNAAITLSNTVETPSVTSAGWATYVTPCNLEFAEGDAFVVSAATASTATLAPVTKIGANKAVLLKGEGVKTATVLNEAPAVANELAISTGGEIDGFVLAKKNDKVGFYKWAGGSLTSGKVYLPAPAGARDYLEFSFDETTALTLVNSEKRTVNSDIYNLAGQRVANPTKGLYIVNGKKVVIK